MYRSSEHAEMYSNTLLLPFLLKENAPRRHVIVVATCFLVSLNIILASTLLLQGSRVYRLSITHLQNQ
jgi:hypothetical protein